VPGSLPQKHKRLGWPGFPRDLAKRPSMVLKLDQSLALPQRRVPSMIGRLVRGLSPPDLRTMEGVQNHDRWQVRPRETGDEERLRRLPVFAIRRGEGPVRAMQRGAHSVIQRRIRAGHPEVVDPTTLAEPDMEANLAIKSELQLLLAEGRTPDLAHRQLGERPSHLVPGLTCSDLPQRNIIPA